MRIAYLKEYSVDVHEDGSIYNRKGRRLKAVKCRAGYSRIYVKKQDGKRSGVGLHRLMALAFIPNPENKGDVNHKDGNKDNNQLSNLEWMTRSENIKHGYDTGLLERVRKSKKKPERDAFIAKAVAMGFTYEELAEAFGLHSGSVYLIARKQLLKM